MSVPKEVPTMMEHMYNKMQLQEMPDCVLYELYDALDCMKTLDSEAAMLIYRDIMSHNKAQVIDALQLVIIEAISNRR
jgi:hypothetical protein